jgi:hypothetical protein
LIFEQALPARAFGFTLFNSAQALIKGVGCRIAFCGHPKTGEHEVDVFHDKVRSVLTIL